jgi:hypothetical protein
MAALPRLLRAALLAAERGWPVFPVVPYGKPPAITGWPVHATRDPDALAEWWRRAPYNVGISCGPAQLLVVDLDGSGDPPPEWAGAVDGRAVFTELARRADADLAATFTVGTPSGGEHRYYSVATRQAARSTAGTLGWHVDTRGTGGYVLAAGSVLRGRRYYRVLDPTPPVPAPAWLLDLLTPPPVRSEPVVLPAARRPAYGQAALDGETRLVRRARPGTRNAVLFRAAVRLGTLAAAGVLNSSDVHDQLHAAASVHFGTDDFTATEADRTITNGLRYGEQHPRRLHDS